MTREVQFVGGPADGMKMLLEDWREYFDIDVPEPAMTTPFHGGEVCREYCRTVRYIRRGDIMECLSDSGPTAAPPPVSR